MITFSTALAVRNDSIDAAEVRRATWRVGRRSRMRVREDVRVGGASAMGAEICGPLATVVTAGRTARGAASPGGSVGSCRGWVMAWHWFNGI